jgi:simple sugar transport system permease protein
MTPFLLAATGGTFSALSGLLNIALEGLMLNAAFFAVVFTNLTGNLFLGVIGAIVTTLLLTALFGGISFGLKANIFICGLATNFLAIALTIVLSHNFYGKTGSVQFPGMPQLTPINIPLIERIPILGSILSGHNVIVYISWLLLIVAAIAINRTPFGMRVRAVGLNEMSARSIGINAKRIQFITLLISGFTCALGGTVLTMTLGAFVPNVTSGRGWIALVIIYLGRKRPVGILIGSVIFGFVEYLSNNLQTTSDIPSGLLLSLPFFVTVLALVLYSIIEQGMAKKGIVKIK